MNELVRRAAVATLSATAIALLVSGCAGGAVTASSASPAPTVTVTATETVTPTPSATPTATAQPLPSPEPSTTRCLGSELSLEYQPDPDASGAGNSAFDLIFTNVDDRACTLTGVPGVYAAAPDGIQVGPPAAAEDDPLTTIDLIPGARADVRVAWHSPGALDCEIVTSAYLVAEVLDGDDATVRAPAEIQVCADDTVYMDASSYTLLG
ncbi:DUF4232 domain-containing protein [Rathayibacter sp. VKM Ac-2760]|uniref:DUF4232 domain-containing protein n=1 Tax=Rathayibacter sp. VKM Ac-2760 TaxID=2609253 RepID=UPI0013187783|nr:DUF4232 domain-containing protein [Rathayibacter sp. VKM Ac-2760]QHC58336.1 DUF4232 domain-containing protein [Rathayibacter sp. VKM Ac-2760]